MANEQLLTQQEELRRQAEELIEANAIQHELKEQAERTAREMEWLGRMPRENPNPVFRISLDCQILYRNDAAEELCRLWNCDEGIPPAMRELIHAAQGGADAVTHEFTLGDHTYLLDIAPFKADGYVNLYALDITERKQAEEALRESEERFRTMADGLPLMIWVTDAHGDMLFVNRTYRDFFGVTFDQVRGPAWQPLVHPEDAPSYIGKFLACTREHGPFLAEARVRRADGQWRWVESHGVPLLSPAGDFLGFVGGSPDITERKQAEESLRELNATLETRVSRRTAELEHRARQLQKLALELSQAEEQERRRLAEILHDDLQQQLAAVKFHLGILSSRTRDDPGVQKSVAQLDKMLRDAIETSRSLSHELSPAVMYHGDLGEILEWLANQIRTKHGLLVQVDARGQIDVESDALKTFLLQSGPGDAVQRGQACQGEPGEGPAAAAGPVHLPVRVRPGTRLRSAGSQADGRIRADEHPRADRAARRPHEDPQRQRRGQPVHRHRPGRGDDGEQRTEDRGQMRAVLRPPVLRPRITFFAS